MELHTKDLFPDNFKEQFKDILAHGHTEYINAGGRGSCKSSFMATDLIILMLQNQNYNALIVRKVSNTLRDSVYNEIKKVIARMGIEHLFSFNLQPLQVTIKATGQTIFFRGADDPLKIKSITVPKGYIAITWFEETAEFTYNDIETIKLSTMRGGDYYYNFFSYNPPSSTRSWVNTEFRKPRKDRYFLESNYLTVPPEWLGDAFLFEAEQMKLTNERAYKNIFLGEPTGTGTNVFENIELREITDEEIEGFEWNYYGIDWGFYPDYFRFAGCSYSIKENILYIYEEFSAQKCNNREAAERLKKYLKEQYKSELKELNGTPNAEQLKEQYLASRLNDRITADSSEPKSVYDFREYDFNVRGAIKGAGSREMSFKWLQGIKKIIIDPARCPYSADEFSLYEYTLDKRTGEVIEGFPDGQPDHSIDAVRYALEEVWRGRGN